MTTVQHHDESERSGRATACFRRMAPIARRLWLVILIVAGLASAVSLRAQDGRGFHDICKDSCCLTDVLLLNTGYDHAAGGTYTPPGLDAYWHVVSDPAGGAVPRAADVIPAAPVWPAAQGGSQWIGGVPTPYDPTLGKTVYEKCFCVCDDKDGRVSTYNLNLSILADDEANVFIDGGFIGNVPAPGFLTPTVINTQVQLAPGVHCIQVEVDNNKPKTAGLDLVGSIQGPGLVRYNCCNNAFIEPPTDCEIRELQLPTDNTWTLVNGPAYAGPFPRCADIVTSPNGGWAVPITGTNWIGPNSTGASNYGDYEYRKCFCLLQPSTVTITISSMADDSGEGYLNGVPITNSAPWGGPPNTTTVIAYLGAGCHCFDFVVHDLAAVVSGLDAMITIQGLHIAKPECCDCANCDAPPPLKANPQGEGREEAVGGLHNEAASRAMMVAVPNPADGLTTLHYVLETAGDVSFDLYDAAGQLVRPLEAGSRTAGRHQVAMETKTLTAGTYFAVLKTNGKTHMLPVSVR